MKSNSFLHLLIPCLLAGSALAGSDRVWVISGGPNLSRSQVQIEQNVLWALEAMDRVPGEREVRVFFTDGEDPTPDVHEWSRPVESFDTLQPIARVFDSYWNNGFRYRNHRIPNVAGSTEAETLVRTLGSELRALQPEDRGWLFFIGHGNRDENLNNRIELWNDTALGVPDLKSLLDQVPVQTRLRFLFTQCYAGAFAALATPGANRCGFLAEGVDQESEGCSAAIEKKDFEDYSTYFFAALTGHPRNGAGLNGWPDWNTDGLVTPLEAHFHVLATAYSADIPRSTSEVLLLEWQPANLSDLLAAVAGTENEYTELAHRLMYYIGIDSADVPDQKIEQRQRDLQAQWARLEQDHDRLRQEIIALQETLKHQVLRRWPQASSPYTLNFKRFLETDLDDAQAYIQAHPDYPGLRERQERFWEEEDRALDLMRARAQLDKVGHLLRLAGLKAALESHGPKELLQRYQALRECESAPF